MPDTINGDHGHIGNGNHHTEIKQSKTHWGLFATVLFGIVGVILAFYFG